MIKYGDTSKRGSLPKGYEIWNLLKKQKPGWHKFSITCLLLLIATTFLTGRAQLGKVIDADGHGVLKHLGQIADSMIEWEGRISDELKLTSCS